MSFHFRQYFYILFSDLEHSHFYITLTFVEWLPFAVGQSSAEIDRIVTVPGRRPQSRNVTRKFIYSWTINIPKDTSKITESF